MKKHFLQVWKLVIVDLEKTDRQRQTETNNEEKDPPGRLIERAARNCHYIKNEVSQTSDQHRPVNDWRSFQKCRVSHHHLIIMEPSPKALSMFLLLVYAMNLTWDPILVTNSPNLVGLSLKFGKAVERYPLDLISPKSFYHASHSRYDQSLFTKASQRTEAVVARRIAQNMTVNICVFEILFFSSKWSQHHLSPSIRQGWSFLQHFNMPHRCITTRWTTSDRFYFWKWTTNGRFEPPKYPLFPKSLKDSYHANHSSFTPNCFVPALLDT